MSQSQAPAGPESTPRRLHHTAPAATWGPWPRCPAASSAPPAPAQRSWRLRRGRRPRAPLSPWRSAVNTAGSGSTRPRRHAGLTLGPSAGHCRPAPRTPAAASTRRLRAGAPLVLEQQPALPTLPATRRHAPRSRQVGIPDPVPSGSAFSPHETGLPCCSRPRPFICPGAVATTRPATCFPAERTLGLAMRKEAPTSPGCPGPGLLRWHALPSVSQVTQAQFSTDKSTAWTTKVKGPLPQRPLLALRSSPPRCFRSGAHTSVLQV